MCEMQISQRVSAPFMEVKLQLFTKPTIPNFGNNSAHSRSANPRKTKHINPHLRWQITKK